jgi:5-methyltetrahydropteroyltriglutamate--homocysteine methyltransferase
VDGLHLDAVNARDEIDPALDALGADKVLSLGVIDGSDIWKTDLHATLAWLEPVQRRIGSRLWIAPSCSLQHVPLDLESAMHAAMDADDLPDPALRPWFAFALHKLEELRILAHALEHGRSQVQFELVANAAAVDRRHAALRAAA